MSKTRLYIAEKIEPGSKIELNGDQSRYVGRVLRLQPGATIRIFDGSGMEYGALIRTPGKETTGLLVTEALERDAESPLSIRLLQGVSRGERMDLVVQKATELGVTKITPVLCERTVVRLDKKRASKRLRHWHGIAVSACEQCGRNVLPVIDAPLPLAEWIGANPADDHCRAILKPGAPATFDALLPANGKMVVLVGPEGGFSDTEYGIADAAGFQAVGLGPRLLRTETAAIAVLAVLQGLYGDLA